MFKKIKINFDLADPGGVLFFANAFSLAHQNIENIIRDEWSLWELWFNHSKIGVPLRHAEADYLRPMRAGKEYTLNLKLEKISDHSVIFCTIFLDSRNEKCAVVKTSHVFIDKSELKKTKIPVQIKQKIETLEFV